MGAEMSMDPVEVLIVTRGSSALHGQLPALVESVGLRWRLSRTVYEAAAEIVTRDRGTGLIAVGTLVELGREKNCFLDLVAARRDVMCCLLTERSTDAAALAAVVQWGATISTSVAELAKTIRRVAEDLHRRMRATRIPSQDNLTTRMNVLSEAELEAILGEDYDEKSRYSIIR